MHESQPVWSGRITKGKVAGMKPGEKFFRGVIREPEGSGEKVVVGKATKFWNRSEK